MSEWSRLRTVLAAVQVPANTDAWLDSLATVNGVHVVSFVNAHAFNLAARDPGFAAALAGSDSVLRDGSGMKILMQMMGREPGPNLNGTDLIPLIITRQAALGRAIALLGTRQPWLAKAADNVADMGGRVVLVEDGFQDDAHYLSCLAQSPCDLIILGMGMPKQERVSMLLRERLEGVRVIVNGGAILDFLAGRVERAPGWMRALGLEWVYRLGKEPRRLFGRYILGNGVFLWRAMRLKLGAA